MQDEDKHFERRSTMKIIFYTGEYENEHGRTPKGRGHWGFTFEGYEFWARGTYAEAKKACREEVYRLAPRDSKGRMYTGTVDVKVMC